MIRFACPGCGAVYAVADEKAGKTGKCPKCQSQFVIPSSLEPEVSREAEPSAPEPSADAPVEVNPCPGCGVRLSVAPGDVGREVACPYCAAEFVATAPGAEPPPPPTSQLAVRDEDRPSRRRSRRDDEDDRPSRRRSRYRRDDDEDDDRPRRSRRARKPSEIGAIGGMLLGGGILALLMGVGVGGSFCCLWPPSYFSLVWGVLAIIRGSSILGQNDNQGPPRTLLILQICLVLNLDVINMALGIVGLVLLNNPAVRDYYARFED